MAKAEGKTHIQVRIGNKVVSKVITSTHNDDPKETDRELTEQYSKEKRG